MDCREQIESCPTYLQWYYHAYSILYSHGQIGLGHKEYSVKNPTLVASVSGHITCVASGSAHTVFLNQVTTIKLI